VELTLSHEIVTNKHLEREQMNVPEEFIDSRPISLAFSPRLWYRLNKGIVMACFNFHGIIKHQTKEILQKSDGGVSSVFVARKDRRGG